MRYESSVESQLFFSLPQVSRILALNPTYKRSLQNVLRINKRVACVDFYIAVERLSKITNTLYFLNELY